MKRILIPYFNAGFGHISFARAIEAEIRRREPGWEVRLMDAGAEIPAEKLTGLYVGAWQWILAQPGFIKSFAFTLSRRVPWAFDFFNRRAIKEALPGLRTYLEAFTPDIVVPTHWGCSHLFDAGRREYGFNFPIAYLYTELASAYRQVVCGADRYFCLTEEARDALVEVGVATDRIRIVDLIVQADLAAELPERRESRESLGLMRDTFTVLFSLGGEGIGNAVPYLDHYFEYGSRAQILVLTGKNTAFLRMLESRYPVAEGRARIVPVGIPAEFAYCIRRRRCFRGKVRNKLCRGVDQDGASVVDQPGRCAERSG